MAIPIFAAILYGCYQCIILPAIWLLMHLAMCVSPKARLRHSGVRVSWERLRLFYASSKHSQTIWFHAASSGEFESLKPIIEHIRQHKSIAAIDVKIVVSLFSPSGFLAHQAYPLADCIVYLPLDFRHAMRRFLALVRPRLVIIACNDVWWNCMKELHASAIPTVLVAARLNPRSVLVRTFLGRIFLRELYGYFDCIYSASNGAAYVLHKLGIACILASNPRFDRILHIASQPQSEIEMCIQEHLSTEDTILVAGSTWKKDEEMLIAAYFLLPEAVQERVRLIIVPHDPNTRNVQRLLAALPLSRTFSSLQGAEFSSLLPPYRHIIVDTYGMLLRLYSCAQGAYIGGGFGRGVHNLAEAAVYGVPLASASATWRSPDAEELLRCKALHIVRNAEEMQQWLRALQGQEPEHRAWRAAVGEAARSYSISSCGWSSIIAEQCLQIIITTSDKSCTHKNKQRTKKY